MAEVFIQHSLNSSKTIKCNLALRRFALKGGEGERKWLLEVGTTATTASGTEILPYYVNVLSEDTIEDEIEQAMASLCDQVDWSPFLEDKYAPYIDSFSPDGDDVPIKSAVEIVVADDLPSAGIDLSDLKVVMNNGVVNFDITSEVVITGDPYEYTLTWLPPNIGG